MPRSASCQSNRPGLDSQFHQRQLPAQQQTVHGIRDAGKPGWSPGLDDAAMDALG
jgi:hypothetical protein